MSKQFRKNWERIDWRSNRERIEDLKRKIMAKHIANETKAGRTKPFYTSEQLQQMNPYERWCIPKESTLVKECGQVDISIEKAVALYGKKESND